jgi:hypothetical protein
LLLSNHGFVLKLFTGAVAMKRFTIAAILSVVLPLAACNPPSNPPAPATPPPAPNKPAVDVQAPGVDVKSDKGGTSVRAPGVDIDVNKNK